MLTREQIEQFHRDGFLILRGVFQGPELKLLQDRAHAVAEEGTAKQGQYHLYHTFPDGTKKYYRSERMWDRHDIFQSVTVKPELLTAIGQCVGEPFAPINDSFVCKSPGGNVPIVWHQDPPYGNPAWERTFPVPNFDVDIYLDRSTVENGCVWGIPGHHLVGHVDLKRYTQDELFENFGAVPMVMEPGDVLFHCLSAPHGSIGNTTNTWRRIFYVHYMARSVLEVCYADWIKNKQDPRSSYDARRARIDEFMAARARLGGSSLAGHPLKVGPEGFEYTGPVGTPRNYWGTLLDAMPADEFARRKSLQPLVAR